jgi:alpha-tubulin suppressor-like RCC1 family protein
VLIGPVISHAAGLQHGCAVRTDGSVLCWGSNGFGELGSGSTGIGSPVPAPVGNLGVGTAIAVTAGYHHSCVVSSSGGAKCWGYNAYGQIGVGTRNDVLVPTDVSGLAIGVASLAGGYYHTCALTTAGGVKCWGANYLGQLGDSTFDDRSTPVDVVGLSSGVIAIAVGEFSNCALLATGSLTCWGLNWHGQLGYGDGGAYPVPQAVLASATSTHAAVDVPALQPGWLAALMVMLATVAAVALRRS